MDARTRMKAWREALGLSKQQFAERMNIGPPLVTMWERDNYRTQPSQKNIDRLCALASITLERFWGRLPRAKKKTAAKRGRA